MPYLATMNTPGYLPWDDDPPVFDTASDAWAYLADERRSQEETVATDDSTYSETVDTLDAHASAFMGPNTVYGDTPGYEGNHDLGIAYSVTEVESAE